MKKRCTYILWYPNPKTPLCGHCLCPGFQASFPVIVALLERIPKKRR